MGAFLQGLGAGMGSIHQAIQQKHQQESDTRNQMFQMYAKMYFSGEAKTPELQQQLWDQMQKLAPPEMAKLLKQQGPQISMMRRIAEALHIAHPKVQGLDVPAPDRNLISQTLEAGQPASPPAPGSFPAAPGTGARTGNPLAPTPFVAPAGPGGAQPGGWDTEGYWRGTGATAGVPAVPLGNLPAGGGAPSLAMRNRFIGGPGGIDPEGLLQP